MSYISSNHALTSFLLILKLEGNSQLSALEQTWNTICKLLAHFEPSSFTLRDEFQLITKRAMNHSTSFFSTTIQLQPRKKVKAPPDNYSLCSWLRIAKSNLYILLLSQYPRSLDTNYQSYHKHNSFREFQQDCPSHAICLKMASYHQSHHC